LERKYIVIIGMLLVGFLAGVFVLARQRGGIDALVADLTHGFDAGQWVEIKPRTENSAAANENTNKDIQTSKAKKPAAPIQWCKLSNCVPAQTKIIFNEIAWMGTAISHSDEWIELKNISGQDIDLVGWQVQNKNQKIKILFGENEILAASGLYLLERTDDNSAPEVVADKIYSGGMNNSNEALYLFDADCHLQDLVTVINKWPAGDNASKKTMIRLPNLTWQTDASIGGTPKAENR